MNSIKSLSAKEKEAASLIAMGKKDEAMTVLFELVVSYASVRNFSRAEKLQEMMMKVDPLAISQIVAAADRIEEERNKAIDKEHLEQWKPWYARLNDEERSAFFFACKPKKFSVGDIFFRQGDFNEALYFVDKGTLQLSFVSEAGREVLIRRVGPGDLAGEDTFYKSSVCTTTLAAVSVGKVQVITRQVLLELDKKVPGLAPKLRDFVSEFWSVNELLQNKGVNRRAHRRIPAQGTIVFQVLSDTGSNTSSQALFKGRMADISAGGLSFYVQTANGKAIRKLLGRSLGMKFLLMTQAGSQSMVCKGRVTGVLCHMNNEYSIHVKFDKPLDPLRFL